MLPTAEAQLPLLQFAVGASVQDRAAKRVSLPLKARTRPALLELVILTSFHAVRQWCSLYGQALTAASTSQANMHPLAL